jgi:hypothetical protein
MSTLNEYMQRGLKIIVTKRSIVATRRWISENTSLVDNHQGVSFSPDGINYLECPCKDDGLTFGAEWSLPEGAIEGLVGFGAATKSELKTLFPKKKNLEVTQVIPDVINQLSELTEQIAKIKQRLGEIDGH